MNFDISGFIVGFMFGMALFFGGLANPDKIIGTLRLKDLHALRVIMLFIIIGMAGVWLLNGALGIDNFNIKPAYLLSNLAGGALLGIGFGLTGYCPGTGLACAAAGRLDALVTVFGMFAGALVYLLLYEPVMVHIESIFSAGKVTLPEITGIPRFVWALVFIGLGLVVVILTSPKNVSSQ
jgi:hypothetical protein